MVTILFNDFSVKNRLLNFLRANFSIDALFCAMLRIAEVLFNKCLLYFRDFHLSLSISWKRKQDKQNDAFQQVERE